MPFWACGDILPMNESFYFVAHIIKRNDLNACYINNSFPANEQYRVSAEIVKISFDR